jgi:hypothetical protein
MLAMSSQPVAGFLDPLIESVTTSAVTSATAAAQPLLNDIEKRVKNLLLPVVFFTAGSFLIGLLTYRAVVRKNKSLSGSRR